MQGANEPRIASPFAPSHCRAPHIVDNSARRPDILYRERKTSVALCMCYALFRYNIIIHNTCGERALQMRGLTARDTTVMCTQPLQANGRMANFYHGSAARGDTLLHKLLSTFRLYSVHPLQCIQRLLYDFQKIAFASKVYVSYSQKSKLNKGFSTAAVKITRFQTVQIAAK